MKPFKLKRAFRTRSEIAEIVHISNSTMYRKMCAFQKKHQIKITERLLSPAIQSKLFPFLGFGGVDFEDD